MGSQKLLAVIGLAVGLIFAVAGDEVLVRPSPLAARAANTVAGGAEPNSPVPMTLVREKEER